MPYAGEVANSLGHVSTAKSKRIADVISQYEVVADDPTFKDAVLAECVPLSSLDLPVTPDSVSLCLSVDGSRQQDVADNTRIGGVSLGYVKVGGCFTDLIEYRALTQERFIDPVRERSMWQAAILEYAMPGSGLRVKGVDIADAWRAALDGFFTSAFVTDGLLPEPQGLQVSLADAVLLLHGSPGHPATRVPVKTCPVCNAHDRDFLTHVDLDGGRCPECSAHLYLADSLGLSSVMTSETGRENTLTLTMNAAERLALVAFIELLLTRGADELTRTLIVADGPLAAFGPLAAPLTRPLRRYIDEVGDLVLNATGRPLLLTGVEKSGEFTTHGETIRTLIEPGHVMRMPNDYIVEYITGRSRSDKPYGAEHLYGRRFFYRRHDGHLLTLTIPAAVGVVPWGLDAESIDWASYPTLRPIIELLESLKTASLDGAVAPLVFAHRVAALPMGTGQSVLTLLAQEGLGLAQNTRVRAETRRQW